MAKSNMMRYMAFAQKGTGKSIANWDELYRWSVDHPAEFWSSIWDYFKVIHSRPPEGILTGTDIMTASWFTGARMNFAENLLRYRDDRTAIIARSEGTAATTISYRQLFEHVASCAASFLKLGVGPSDRVAAFIPNIPQAIIGMLAATSLGAIWSSCSPDFGFQGVVDRFGQIEPKILIAATGYQYNGRLYDSIPTVRAVADAIGSIERVILIPHVAIEKADLPKPCLEWQELLDFPAAGIDFAQLPFDHPIYIMYSSGTTGAPKCIVHGAGGTLLQHLKELALHTDLKREDIITYYTTCGWMMWNWLVSSLALGATVYLYDGSPSFPDIGILFREVENEGISIFGTSPAFLSACEKAGQHPGAERDLGSLRTMLSTGSPLSETNFEYVYNRIKPDIQLSSISGGTDIISCFLLGNPLLPVYPGELQCRGLGMKVETFNDDGQIIYNTTGELVCLTPFPSRPIMFWNDPDGAKYRAAYFEHFPGVWRHGDYININDHGGIVVYGRSDATLNPGGVRIGTAEIYEPVERMVEIRDSIVVEQKTDQGSRIVLFVVPAEGYTFNDALREKIKSQLRRQRTPRHVPSVIVAVSEIPRTINAKKVELAVTNIIHGRPVTNIDALANPESLAQFENLPELRID